MLRLICCQANLWISMTYERPDVGSGESYFAAQSVVPVRTATNHSPRRSVTLAGPRHELQERRQDPFRHPPDHLTTHDVGGQGPLRAPHGHGHLAPQPGLRQPVARHPEAVLHFVVGAQRGAARQREYERPHHDGRQHGGDGGEVVEHGKRLAPAQVDARLLARLTDRGREQVAVCRLAPAARQGNLPRPRVTGAHGPADEQDFGPVLPLDESEGDGRRAGVGRHGGPAPMAPQGPAGGGGLGDIRKVGRLGLRTLGFFWGTTLAAILIGFVVAAMLLPLAPIAAEQQTALRGVALADSSLLQHGAAQAPSGARFIVDLVPANPLRAAVDGNRLPLVVFVTIFAVAPAALPAASGLAL